LDGVSGLTIGIWVKQDTHHDNGIVVKLTTAGSAWPCSYNLETWSDQLAYFDVDKDAGAYATANYPLNEWYYLVGVFDGDKGEDRIYINGKFGKANPRVVKVVPDGKEPVYVGCVSPGTNPFKGALDELVIYNRVLTDAEISENMNGVIMAVDGSGKLSTTWSAIKNQKQ
jgi:beta-fructofuranosidase